MLELKTLTTEQLKIFAAQADRKGDYDLATFYETEIQRRLNPASMM